MSRRVRNRYTISATLVAAEPIHIGGVGEGLTSDMLCTVDGRGRHYLPGPSLAGALRAELRARGIETAHLWGGDDTETASQVVVADAPATGRPVVEIRDGVSIDPDTGTARPGLLYTREVLPAGTNFTARITIDDLEAHPHNPSESTSAGPGDPATPPEIAGQPTPSRDAGPRLAPELPASSVEVLAKQVAGVLTGDGLAVGAFATKGMGRLRADSVALTRRDLGSRKGVLDLLYGKPTPVDHSDTVVPPRTGEVTVTIPWRARGPILVSRALDGGATDTLPLTAGSAAGDRLAIAGSSIKGAMRAQATRIVATMGNPPAAAQAVVDLFGAAGDSTRDPATGSRVNSGRRGILRVNEVLSTRTIPAQTTLGIPDPSADDVAALNKQLDTIAIPGTEATGGLELKVGDHVAIDRWTGGAYESALYSVVEPWQTTSDDWTPIRLAVELARIPDGQRRGAAIGLLVLVLRDLCDGWFGIGFGTARGYGAIQAHAHQVQLGGLAGSGLPTLGDLVHGGGHQQVHDWVGQLWPTRQEEG